MNTDVAFVTGYSHRVCQDYARCGTGYVLVSDGCSSSKDSDFGSRILVKTAESLLLREMSGKERWDQRETVNAAALIRQQLGLNEYSLDATLLTAKATEKTVEVYAFGDGYVAIKNRDGTIKIIEIKFPSGYPYYLSYLCDGNRHAMLKEIYAKEKSFKQITELTDPPVTTEVTMHDDDKLNALTLSLPLEQVSFVALLSDGVGSFLEKTTRVPVPPLDIIRELLAFKATNGFAVQRRMNAFLRDANKKNYIHDDDISLGTLFIDG
jgi:hypothetical protein